MIRHLATQDKFYEETRADLAEQLSLSNQPQLRLLRRTQFICRNRDLMRFVTILQNSLKCRQKPEYFMKIIDLKTQPESKAEMQADENILN